MPKVSVKPAEKPAKKELDWEPGNVSARTRGYKSMCIPAMVCGPLSIHAGMFDEGLWAITHKVIGYNFIELPDADEAIELANLLLTDPRFEEALKQKTWTNFFKELPAWVFTWRKEMLKQQKLLPIAEFERDEEAAPVKANPFMDRYLTLRDKHDFSKDCQSSLIVKIGGGYEMYQGMAVEASKVLKVPLLSRADLGMVRISEKDLDKARGLLQNAGIKTVVMDFPVS